jgi:hypothetical protein
MANFIKLTDVLGEFVHINTDQIIAFMMFNPEKMGNVNEHKAYTKVVFLGSVDIRVFETPEQILELTLLEEGKKRVTRI